MPNNLNLNLSLLSELLDAIFNFSNFWYYLIALYKILSLHPLVLLIYSSLFFNNNAFKIIYLVVENRSFFLSCLDDHSYNGCTIWLFYLQLFVKMSNAEWHSSSVALSFCFPKVASSISFIQRVYFSIQLYTHCYHLFQYLSTDTVTIQLTNFLDMAIFISFFTPLTNVFH